MKSFIPFVFVAAFFFFVPETSAQNAWIQKSTLPGPVRADASGFVIGDNIYVTCGTTSSSPLNDLWEYSTLTDTWTQKASLPATARFGAAGFTAGLKGYVCCGKNGTQMLADLWQYDPQTDSW